jgi:hypothetical protein
MVIDVSISDFGKMQGTAVAYLAMARLDPPQYEAYIHRPRRDTCLSSAGNPYDAYRQITLGLIAKPRCEAAWSCEREGHE